MMKFIIFLVLFLAIVGFGYGQDLQDSTKITDIPDFRLMLEEEFNKIKSEKSVREALIYYIARYDTIIAQLRNVGVKDGIIPLLERSKKRCEYDLNNYIENSPERLDIPPQKGPRSTEFIENISQAEELLWKSKHESGSNIEPEPQLQENNDTKSQLPTIQNIEKPITNLIAQKETLQENKENNSHVIIEAETTRIMEKEDESNFSLLNLLLKNYIFIILVLLCVLSILYGAYFFIKYRKVYNYAKSLEIKLEEKDELINSCETAMRKIHSNILNNDKIPTEEDLDPEVVYNRLKDFVKQIFDN